MFVLDTRKAVMPKMKSVAARNLLGSTKFTTQINDSTNEKWAPHFFGVFQLQRL
jgi:hypothetical protein